MKERETDLTFDAEKFGFDFLEERKRLANEELEKLKIEIEELDSELNENENSDKKEVEVDENKVNENKVQNLTKIEKPAKTEEQIFKSVVKEIEKENKRKTEERESIANFLLFSVLSGEIDVQMKLASVKKAEKNENEEDSNFDVVTFSIQKIENDKNENKFFDEKEVADVLKVNNEIKQSNTKGKENEIDQNEDFLSLTIGSKIVLMSSKIENSSQANDMKNNDSNSDDSENEIASNSETKKIVKDTATVRIQKDVDFFVIPESVLGPRIVRAFEVILDFEIFHTSMYLLLFYCFRPSH